MFEPDPKLNKSQNQDEEISYLNNKAAPHHRNANPLVNIKENLISNGNINKNISLPLRKEDYMDLVPREYQIQLYEKALKGNIIAVLETGAGKTLIAIMLIRQMLLNERALRQKDPKRPRKICIFLVNIVPLVAQQSSVIANNIPFKVARLFGEMGIDFWVESKWREVIDNTDVLVLTAQIFLDMLRHGRISLDQTCLLIFDECHHAKKNHPYNLIMKEFYSRIYKGGTNNGNDNEYKCESEPPKIFSMTASPLSNMSNAIVAATSLENVLDSKIFTINYKEEVMSHISRPKEICVKYKPFHTTLETNHLVESIGNACAPSQLIKKIIDNYKYILQELGQWCAILFFRKILEDTIENYKNGIFSADNRNIYNTKNTKSATNEEEYIKRATEIYTQYLDFIKDKDDWLEHDPYDLDEVHVSPKVKALLEILIGASVNLDSFCGIIFIQRKCTAVTLNYLIKHTSKLNKLNSNLLLGHDTNSAISKFSMDFKKQEKVITDFRNGKLNLIIATSVAEEGLDIQPCNLVVRFDDLPTLISYIQSRGRARHKKSFYVILQEEGNKLHESRLITLQKAEETMIKWCSELPEDRFMESLINNIDLNDKELYRLDKKEFESLVYEVKSTKAIVTIFSSVSLVYRYCSSLPYDSFCVMLPRFNVFHQNGYFNCILTMPPNCPIVSTESGLTKSKLMAKQLASWKLCTELHKIGHLNDYLLPVGNELNDEDYEPKKSDLSTEEIEEGTWRAVKLYNLKLPEFWNNTNEDWNAFYINMIDISEINQLSNEHFRPFAIITRKPLPEFNPIILYFKGKEVRINVKKSFKAANLLNNEQINLLLKFTLFTFKSIFNKEFECTSKDIQYFFVPIKHSYKSDPIDWQIISEVNADDYYLDYNLGDELIICDTTDNYVMYKVKKIREDLRSDSIVPKDMRLKIKDNIAFFDFNESKLKKVTNLKQSVLEVERVHVVLNYLTLHKNQKIKMKGRFDKCLFKKFAMAYSIPSSVFNSIMLLPSIMSRIDHLLLIKEVKLNLNVPDIIDEHILEALTLPAANISMDYERLELLGDSFLKFIVSIDLFLKHPNKHEGQLHCRRIRVIGNRFLFKCCRELNLPLYVNPRPFNRAKWRPPHFTIRNRPEDKQKSIYKMADKQLSDIAEAILGSAVTSGGEESGLRCAKSLGIPLDGFNKWSDITNYLPQTTKIDRNRLKEVIDIDYIEKVIGYNFSSPSLLVEAFTHASFPYPLTPCYQRLEFLGDAVLDYFVTSYLFSKYPDASPGSLTEVKGACVSNNTLGAIMETLNLHTHIIHGSSVLIKDMSEFINIMKQLREQGDINGNKEYWYDIKAPKVIADVLEAILGAVFVDSKFDVKVTMKLFESIIQPIYDLHLKPDYVIVHPIIQLTRYCHRNYCKELDVKCNTTDDKSVPEQERTLCEIIIHDRIVASARGKVVKQARKYAAQKLLNKFKENKGLLKSLCNCMEGLVSDSSEDEHEDEQQL